MPADEIHLRLDDSEISLRPALKNETPAQGCDVGDARHVQKDVLGKHRGQSGEDLFRSPTLTLEIDDVRLKEDRAAIAELRHSPWREMRSRQTPQWECRAASAAACRKYPLPGRALRIQTEISYRSILQHDDLDVLAAYVDDGVHVWV